MQVRLRANVLDIIHKYLWDRNLAKSGFLTSCNFKYVSDRFYHNDSVISYFMGKTLNYSCVVYLTTLSVT
jgi:hypothetical protein